MRITFLPKTPQGWWSTGLCIVSILFFVLFTVIMGPGPDYNMALAYSLTAILSGIAVAALMTGLIGTTKKKERSVIVFLAMAISLNSVIGGIVSLLGLAK